MAALAKWVESEGLNKAVPPPFKVGNMVRKAPKYKIHGEGRFRVDRIAWNGTEWVVDLFIFRSENIGHGREATHYPAWHFTKA